MEQVDAVRLRFDAFELDEADARLKRNGVPIALAPKAFAVLCALARQPGTLVTKDALLDAVWGHRHVSESVLKTTISEVRAALEDDAKQPRYIETASRRGYRFIAGTNAGAIGNAEPMIQQTSALDPSSGLIGRHQALAKLNECWRKSTHGERQLVWVEGDAGVGKSKLIDMFLSEHEGAVVARGQCVEHFGTGEPFLPILEAIRELCRIDPQLVSIMRTVAPTWTIQMPWLLSEAERANLLREVAGAHPDRMVREMRELMDRFTAERPLIFVLEDLHWSDVGTLRMMEHFARRPRSVKILWIATFRLTQVIAEEHPLRDLRQELRFHRLCEEILLEPFSESEVGAYLAERVQNRQIPESFIRRLHAHTEGLPLFVANVAEVLIAQAASDPEAARAMLAESSTAPLPVPDNLSGIIEKQIARLNDDIQRVLEAASVCGADFRVGVVAAILERDPAWVGKQCDELARRQFWLKHGEIVELPEGSIDTRYTFLHALYQHVFYDRLSPPQRVQLHRRAVKALESLRAAGEPIAAAELASHCERGVQLLQAIRYYTEAAEYAAAHFAATDAFNLTAVALALLERVPESQQRMEFALALIHQRGMASAQLFGIGAEETASSFERARALCEALPETPLRAILLNGLGVSRYVQGDFAQAQALGERVREIAKRTGDPMLLISCSLLQGMVHGVQGRYAEALRIYEEGIAVLEAVGDKLPLQIYVVDPGVAMWGNSALPLMHIGKLDRAREQIRLASDRARKTGQPMARMLALWVGGIIEIGRESPDTVAQIAEELSAIVEKNVLKQGEGPALWLRGYAKAHRGEPREGFRLIREGYEMQVRTGMVAGMTMTLYFAADALLLMDDWRGAEIQVDEAFELSSRINEQVALPSLHVARARIANGQGEEAEAVSHLRESIRIAREQGAALHELRALLYLHDFGAAQKADTEELKSAYHLIREGLETPLMKKAARLFATSI